MTLYFVLTGIAMLAAIILGVWVGVPGFREPTPVEPAHPKTTRGEAEHTETRKHP